MEENLRNLEQRLANLEKMITPMYEFFESAKTNPENEKLINAHFDMRYLHLDLKRVMKIFEPSKPTKGKPFNKAEFSRKFKAEFIRDHNKKISKKS